MSDSPAPGAPGEPLITLLTRPGCSLCGPVRRRVIAVAERTGVGWHELDVDQDPALREAWTDKVPVVLVAGRVHAVYRVQEEDLARAVEQAQRTAGTVDGPTRSVWRGIIRRRR